MTNTKVQSLADEKNKLDTLEESLLYVQSQPTPNNLIFTNIHEAVGEAYEQTEHKLREFLVEKYKLVQQGANDIQFERVHRLGRHRNNGPRDIVAKFTLFKEREVVRKSRTNLKRTGH